MKKRTIIPILALSFLLMFLQTSVSATWWNTTFTKSMNITFTNAQTSDGNNIIFHYAIDLNGLGVQSDCSDLRLINEDQDTELPFYIENCNNVGITNIDFIMDYCLASSNCIASLYWDNDSIVNTKSDSLFASSVSNLKMYSSFSDTSENYITNHANSTNNLYQAISPEISSMWGNGRNITVSENHNYIIWSINDTIKTSTNNVTLIYWLKDYDNTYRAFILTRIGAFWETGFSDFASHGACGIGNLLMGSQGDVDFNKCLSSFPVNSWFMYSRVMTNDGVNTYEHAYKNETFWGDLNVSGKKITDTFFQFGLGRPDDNSTTAQDFNGELDELQIYYENFTSTKIALVYDTYNEANYINSSIQIYEIFCDADFQLNSTEENCYNETHYAINTTYYDFNECDELYIINYTYPDLPYAYSNYFDGCFDENNFNRTNVYNDTRSCSYNIFNSTFPVLPYSLFQTNITCFNGTTANYTYTYNDTKTCSYNIFNSTLVNCAGNCFNNTCVAPIFPEPVNLYNSFANGGWSRLLDSIIIPLILLILVFGYFKLNPKKLKGKS